MSAAGVAARDVVLRALADQLITSGRRSVPWCGPLMTARFARSSLEYRVRRLVAEGLVTWQPGCRCAAALTLAGWLRVCPAPWPELVTGVEISGGRVQYLYEEAK